MDWRVKKINRLELKKSKLEEQLFMSYNCDDMFDIKMKIEEIEKQIRELEEELEKDNQ